MDLAVCNKRVSFIHSLFISISVKIQDFIGYCSDEVLPGLFWKLGRPKNPLDFWAQNTQMPKPCCYMATILSTSPCQRCSKVKAETALVTLYCPESYLPWLANSPLPLPALMGPMVQLALADTPSPQSATLCLHPAAVATTHLPSRWG